FMSQIITNDKKRNVND
ncbi:hypothetical protein, partial [Lactococcus lactis]